MSATRHCKVIILHGGNMNSYIVFIKGNESKAITADRVTRALPRDLKKKGFTQ